MERFPPEICSHIYSFACTDGGYTGRCLSTVSKYVHETSKPYKYKSIKLHGAHAASAFADILKQSSPDIVGGVAHLFVSNSVDLDTPNQYKAASASTSLRNRAYSKVFSLIPGGKRRQRRQRIRDSMDDLFRDRQNIAAVIEILQLVAPTLQTLTICFISGTYTVPFLDFTSPHPRFPRLPVLTELTLNYRAPLDARFNYHFFCCPTSAASLPSLKRLDISAQILDNHSPQTLFGHIATIAPSLTHLCISARMALDLQDALSDGDDGCLLPPTLRRVCILLDVRHRCTWGSYQPHCYRCRILAMASMDRRINLLPDPGEEAIGHKSCETLIEEWQARINGSEVFWEERDE